MIDANGDLIALAPENEVGLVELTLSKNHLQVLRERLPFLDDKDHFDLKI